MLLAQGCASWREVRRVTPSEYLTEHHPKRARFTLAESTVVLRSPRASADSVVGIEEWNGAPGERRSLPESGIRGLAVRGPSTWPMWIAAGASAALLVAVLASSNDRAIK